MLATASSRLPPFNLKSGFAGRADLRFGLALAGCRIPHSRLRSSGCAMRSFSEEASVANYKRWPFATPLSLRSAGKRESGNRARELLATDGSTLSLAALRPDRDERWCRLGQTVRGRRIARQGDRLVLAVDPLHFRRQSPRETDAWGPYRRKTAKSRAAIPRAAIRVAKTPAVERGISG